jgi:ABC-type branched-subunit amino acid transport system substrate-binding protein
MATVLSALMVTGVGVSLGGSAGASSKSKAPFVIGLNETLSGPVAEYGDGVKAAFDGVFNAVNKAGGIDGHQVDLKLLDDQFSLSQSITNLKQLVTAKPIMVTAGIETNFCAATAPTSRKDKIAESCDATLPNQDQPVQKYLFSRIPPEVTTAQPVINFIPTVVTATPKIATFVADIPGPNLFASEIDTLATAKGWTVAATLSDPAGQPPTSAQVAQLVAADPNVIVVEITSTQNASFLEALRTAGFTGVYISQDSDYSGTQTLQDPNYYSLSPTLFVTPQSTGSSAKLYTKQLASQGVTGAANLNGGQLTTDWVAAVDVADALKACTKAHGGNCTGAQLDAALNTTKVSLPGVVVGAGYTATDHILTSSTYIYGWRASSGVTQIGGALKLGKA